MPVVIAAMRFLGLAKTCDKLGIAVWDYLGSRLKVAGHRLIKPLDHYVRARVRTAGRAMVPTVPPLLQEPLVLTRGLAQLGRVCLKVGEAGIRQIGDRTV